MGTTLNNYNHTNPKPDFHNKTQQLKQPIRRFSTQQNTQQQSKEKHQKINLCTQEIKDKT
jgi:hypothetical protein